jgi:DUF177 domain-containing protein
MKQRTFDPLRLDMAAFGRGGGPLHGEWALADFHRLAEGTGPTPEGEVAGAVQWHAEGEARARRAAAPLMWLHLEAQADVWLQCQRCLKPMREHLRVQRSFRFVSTEAEAEAEDADSDEDVLALDRSLDLKNLVEDELILALPLVPRHKACPQPLQIPADDLGSAQPPHPFAQLVVLKRGKSSH